jgi:catechol-2,3-dioxygenase
MPRIERVLETVLYIGDMKRARSFYEGTLGLTPMLEGDRMSTYPVGDSVLILFKRGDPGVLKLEGGTIPAHDGSGQLHMAFAVEESELAAWEKQFAAKAVEIEGRMKWPKGGTSIYFRDPDGNLLEFATPGLWDNY